MQASSGSPAPSRSSFNRAHKSFANPSLRPSGNAAHAAASAAEAASSPNAIPRTVTGASDTDTSTPLLADAHSVATSGGTKRVGKDDSPAMTCPATAPGAAAVALGPVTRVADTAGSVEPSIPASS